MSTLPSLASKGEKPKSKFQSLDINKIYRVSRGENLEKQTQKSSLPYKHGMQSLGKVPSARRPPANLPSLKSEHSGSDAAVPLVPPGGPGWGKQDSTCSTSSTSPTTTTTNSPPTQQISQPPQLSAHQAAIALPVTTPIPHGPPSNKQPTPPTATPAAIDKSWSAVMSGIDPLHHPPPYQSAQFQQEFPSLSCGDGVPPRPGSESGQYTPGLSLRPQTEGSWIQGGSRPPDAGGRPNSGPMAPPPQLSAQVGQQQQTLPPQYRGVMPPFMFKGNMPANGVTGNLNFNAPASLNGRRVDNRALQRGGHEVDEVGHRPIIKEEELSRMDEIENDLGWAYQDDIDYNQKLAFSDDETLTEKASKKERYAHKDLDKSDSSERNEQRERGWSRSGSTRGRSSEDDEIKIRRTQHSKELELAVLRAKQRKEEEEKRFNEATKQGAKQKLKELEEKINKRDRDHEDGGGTINPSVVPPQQINPIPPEKIPLPDFQKEKIEKQPQDYNINRSRTPIHETHEEKSAPQTANSFKQLTQIEGKNVPRKHVAKGPENESSTGREQNAPSFSRQFQNNLPPRFKKQQSSTNVLPPPQQHYVEYENRWSTSPNAKPSLPPSRKMRDDSPEREIVLVERPERRQRRNSEDSYGSFHRSQSDLSHKSERYDESHDRHDYTRQEQDKWAKDKWVADKKEYEPIRPHDDGRDRREKHKDERPQRPDSRDSRASRESRHSRESEPRELWVDYGKFDYADKRKPHHGKAVPGPITKERIEADDDRAEKRNLTALKRGQFPDKKISEHKIDEKSEAKDELAQPKAWADSDNVSKPKSPYSSQRLLNMDEKKGDEKDDKRGSSNRNRYPQSNKPWSSNEYHRSAAWPKRAPGKGGRHGTDSEGSMEEQNEQNLAHKSPKPVKKFDKDDRNRDIKDRDQLNRRGDRHEPKKDYVPRGEPSRHGRGGGNFRGPGRGAGLSKRIECYGPPPTKSPFAHHEDKRSDDTEPTTEDKIKLSQQALSAGIIGGARKEGDKKPMDDKNKPGKKPLSMDKKSKEGGSISDASDERSKAKTDKNAPPKRDGGLNQQSRRNTGTRVESGDKRYGSRHNPAPRQNSTTGSTTKDVNSLSKSVSDMSVRSNENEEIDATSDKPADADGFQEVKSKKAVNKDKPSKPEESKAPAKPKIEKDIKKRPSPPQLTQQQIQNIPPLMATPVNPPPMMNQANKSHFDRNRPKIAPRFAKLKENTRIQKQMLGVCEVSDMPKVPVYGMKEPGPVPPISNAWDKPLGSQLRMDSENLLGTAMDSMPLEHTTVGQASTQISPNEKDKSMLDGATPPVNTIIFENTNFKSAPGARNPRTDKPRKEDGNMDAVSMPGFNKPISDLLGKPDKPSEALQLPLSFKEDTGEIMKMDFFDSELSQLTEDKSTKMSMSRSIHATITSGNNTISTADALNFKIQSVKKVWETPSDHNVQDDQGSFSTSFGADPNSLDPNAFSKGNDTPDDNTEGYSPSPNQIASNSTTNVCKVKPTQQVSGGPVLNSGVHQPHSGIVMGNPMSPPPTMQPVIGAGVNLGQPPQQYPTNQHIGYQTGLGNTTQYGMSAIPSPPTVMPYSTQLQAAQTGLYGHFQIDQASVLNSQGRSQYSQYQNPYNLSQTPSSPYSAQSIYLQPTQQHPPPTPQADMYSNINNYRLSSAPPFGQTPQMSNSTTVLISSTSNSLMSASVKPSTQQISAIGTKAGGVGQAYQPQSQQGQQMYMFDPLQAGGYLQSTGVMQRGPAGPVQSNVVPAAIQQSSSYYSGSTGGQTGYFQQPTNSSIQPPQLQQPQAGYGLQGSVFGTNQSHNNAGLQSFNSHFNLAASPLQLAAALSAAQQYRSAGLPTQYMKSNLPIGGEQQGRPQQLKSPSQQEVLSSVFNSGPQIPSPKSKQQYKQPPPQPSPTTQHKYNLYQNVGNQSNNVQRYPTPIQRPVNYQQNIGSAQNMSSNNQKHRSNPNNKAPSRQYYTNQNNSLSSQNEKSDDSKISETVSLNKAALSVNSAAGKGSNPTSAVGQSDLGKESKEEAPVLKD